MLHLIKSLAFIVFWAVPTVTFAEQVGRYVSIDAIVINDTTTVPAGAEVNFLGVIDVTLSTAPSGKLATFMYKDQVLNADASLFYEQSIDHAVYAYPPRTFDSGNSSSMCSTLAKQAGGETLDFAKDDFQNYFELTSNNKIVDGFSIARPTDIYSWND